MASPDQLRPDGIEVPLAKRLPAGSGAAAEAVRAEVMKRHEVAVRNRRPTYRDPLSGYTVFTARFLADRGYCCRSGCRHCPYESE